MRPHREESGWEIALEPSRSPARLSVYLNCLM
jgi:hypothetical protein